MARKKQIILTQEEAVALAKKELAPYWIYSSPMVAAVKTPTGAQLFSLEPKYLSTTWAIFNLDLADIVSHRIIDLAVEWQSRYASHSYSGLLVIHPGFEFYKKASTIEDFLNKKNIRIPTVIDFDLGFYTAVEAKSLPQLDITQQGKFSFRKVISKLDLEMISEMEFKLQETMRIPDKGLALPLPYQPESKTFFVKNSISLNMNDGEKAKSIDLSIKGKWSFENGKACTQDATAEMSFTAPSENVAIVTEPFQTDTSGSSFRVLINELPAQDSMVDRDVKFDEVQNATVSFKEGGLFFILKELDTRNRKVTLKFPLAGTKPIAIYGLRFF